MPSPAPATPVAKRSTTPTAIAAAGGANSSAGRPLLAENAAGGAPGAKTPLKRYYKPGGKLARIFSKLSLIPTPRPAPSSPSGSANPGTDLSPAATAATAAATAKATEAAAANNDDGTEEKIQVTLSGSQGVLATEKRIMMDPFQHFGGIFAHIARSNGADAEDFDFLLDGKVVKSEDTPRSLGMLEMDEDLRVIEVVVIGTGG